MSNSAEHFQRISKLMEDYQTLLDRHKTGEITEEQIAVQGFPILVEQLEIFDVLTASTQQILDAQWQEISALQNLTDSLTNESNLQQIFINKMGLRSQYRKYLAEKSAKNKQKFKKGV